MTCSEAFERCLHGIAQGVTPLLQTQQEALDTRPLCRTRLLLQEVFDPGDLDIGIADPS
jgi:hypothetical protein